MSWRMLRAGLLCCVLASCAAPAQVFYTLGVPAQGAPAAPLGVRPIVIAVDRIALPDDLDTQNIVLRHGNVLEASHNGRWATRLSLAATDLVTAILAQHRPDALITDQPQTAAPSYRLVINVSRFDLTLLAQAGDGMATLEADWLIVPSNAAQPALRSRTHIEMMGKLATDQDVVALTAALLTQLAARIDISPLR